jgi:carbon storage regulator CsrA
VLTLTRNIGETIRIGDDIEVHVVEVRGNTVRLGFKAPREVSIHREEVYEQIAAARRLDRGPRRHPFGDRHTEACRHRRHGGRFLGVICPRNRR